MKESPTALQKAVSMLARREHSAHELRHKLTQKDYDQAEIEAAEVFDMMPGEEEPGL